MGTRGNVVLVNDRVCTSIALLSHGNRKNEEQGGGGGEIEINFFFFAFFFFFFSLPMFFFFVANVFFVSLRFFFPFANVIYLCFLCACFFFFFCIQYAIQDKRNQYHRMALFLLCFFVFCMR